MVDTGIIWGQHRTEELIAIGVKNKLIHDQNLRDLTFIEFALWEIDDYIPLLYEKAKDPKNFETLRRNNKERVSDYEIELRRKYGLAMLNLHDGQQIHGVNYEILIIFPHDLEKKEKIREIFESVGRNQNLKVNTNPNNSLDGKFFGPFFIESTLIEFMTPEPYVLKKYPSIEVEQLVRNLDPRAFNSDFRFQYMTPDTTNPLYEKTVNRYSEYIKETLLEIRGLA